MKIIYLTFLAGVALVAPLRAQTNLNEIEKMSPQEFSQMLDRNLGKTTELVPKPTPVAEPVRPIEPPKPHKSESAGLTIGVMYALVFIPLALFFYFLPSIVGSSKRNAGAIFVLNLFTGWSFIGWVIALVWACTKDTAVKAQI